MPYRFSSLLLACLFFCGTAIAQQIALPEKLPELDVTEQASLGTRDQGLAPGQTVPAFSASTHKGAPATLESLLGEAPLLVIFYRGGWCPYCNTQIRALTEAWSEFRQRGVTPVLISADRPDAAAMAQARYQIPFPVLSDPDLQAHEAFDVVMQVDDATAEKYRDYGIVLEDWSGRDHYSIAVPGIFLVDADGQVQWAHVSSDYRTRPGVGQLLAVLDSQQ